MINIGLFFGSFNPIHNGHLMLANYCLNHCDLDKIYFIVSPHNPTKDFGNLLNFDDRLNMVSHALDISSRMMSCDIENHMPIPSYTVETLRKIEELDYFKAQGDTISLHIIIGMDNFLSIEKWDEYEVLLKNNIIVYPRLSVDSSTNEFENKIKELNLPNLNVRLLQEAPLSNMSSSFIRDEIRNNKTITHYVPKIVEDMINNNRFYLK